MRSNTCGEIITVFFVRKYIECSILSKYEDPVLCHNIHGLTLYVLFNNIEILLEKAKDLKTFCDLVLQI